MSETPIRGEQIAGPFSKFQIREAAHLHLMVAKDQPRILVKVIRRTGVPEIAADITMEEARWALTALAAVVSALIPDGGATAEQDATIQAALRTVSG